MNGTSSKAGYGRRLMVDIVDEIAASDPSRPFAFAPRSNEPEDGWEPITYQQLANAINHVAHIVANTVKGGSSYDAFPTVAYIGPNDLRYTVLMLATIKAGSKALFISPRNSLAGQLSLLQSTDCKHLWYPESFEATVEPWMKGRPMQGRVVEPLYEWLSVQSSPFPYSRSFEEARWDPAVVLHTSGSTGTPKLIVVRQGSLAIADGFRELPEYQHEGAEFMWNAYMSRCKAMFVPMPMFHAAALLGIMAILGVYYNKPSVLGMPDKPLTAETALKCIDLADVDAALLPPFIVEELAKDDESFRILKKLNFLTFGGGNLSRSAGDRLVKHGILPNNVISSTEMVPYVIYFQPDPVVWHYFIFNSEIMGADWRCVDEKEGTYELCIRRKDPKSRDPGNQPCFYTFPDLDEWSTGDLYKPHPTLQDHWTYYGRADNIIVFSTGEKLNPVTFEETISAHPAVQGAVVCGQDRFQPALILEPVKSPKNDDEREALIRDVWPLVEEVNKATVAHGRLAQRLVMISDPEVPFPRTPKGSVQRGLTVRAYKEHIAALYKDFEERNIEEPAPLDFSSETALTRSISDLLASRIGVQDVQPDTDFFSLGVDSLQVMSISRILRSSFAEAGVAIDRDALAPRVIYANPTPATLAASLSSIASGGGQLEDDASRERKTFDNLVAKYTKDLLAPRVHVARPDPVDEGQTVLLTGTTGSLGAYLLDGLCTNPRVSKIVALNRGDDGGKSRQASISRARGLATDFSQVEFLHADLSLADLGLGAAKYSELLGMADRVIHNAWPVNFNLGVASFEPYIRGVRHLADFSSQCAKHVPIVFLSSIGTVNAWKSAEPVPEKCLDDNYALAELGYGRSKLAGSAILDAAATHSAIPAASIRVGQIAGPHGHEGMWNKQEYLPSLIASSLYLGMLPKQIGPSDVVDWMPVEAVASLVLDIAGVTTKTPVSEVNGYFHCVNPTQASWTELAEAVKDFYGGRIQKLVSLKEWVAALEKSASVSTDISKNPGVKLLDTYRGMLDATEAGVPHVSLAMDRTIGQSPTVACLGPVTAELMKNWCAQWDF